MKRKRREIGRWELERLEEMIIVPTLKEKKKKGWTDEEWIMRCYKPHKNSKCHRELNGYPLCDLCPKNPKFQRRKINAEWSWVTETEASLNTSR